MAERPQYLTDLRPLTSEDADATRRFLDVLPDGDLTFLKEPADDDTVSRWLADERTHRWVVVGDDGELQAMLSIFPGTLWSSHVGELRLVVGESFRRRGLGRRLARYGLAEAVRAGLRKIVVEVVAEKESDIAMFEAIGFQAEALLRDQICDRDGNLHDLILLSHEVETGASAMEAIGLAGELGLGETR
ncbi:MAG: GNAT family N-acetyltransferase [Marmoricola sp.]